MKTLNKYIIEKLIIKKNLNNYNPDDLNGDNQILYSDMTEFISEDEWDCFIEDLKDIEDKYYGFLVTQFISLSNITVKQLERTLYITSRHLIDDIISEITKNTDIGYEISLIGGHIEIACLNSGSRTTYYVYAFDDNENYNKMIDWASNDISDEKLYKLIFTEGFISEITFK